MRHKPGALKKVFDENQSLSLLEVMKMGSLSPDTYQFMSKFQFNVYRPSALSIHECHIEGTFMICRSSSNIRLGPSVETLQEITLSFEFLNFEIRISLMSTDLVVISNRRNPI